MCCCSSCQTIDLAGGAGGISKKNTCIVHSDRTGYFKTLTTGGINFKKQNLVKFFLNTLFQLPAHLEESYSKT